MGSSQEHCVIPTCLLHCFTGNVRMSSQDDSGETHVIEDACNYVSTKSYLAGDKIRKRIIRRKAQRLAIKDGKLGTILQEKDSIT